VRKNREVRGAAVPRIDTADWGLLICKLPRQSCSENQKYRKCYFGTHEDTYTVPSQRARKLLRVFRLPAHEGKTGLTHSLNCVKRLPPMMVPKKTVITCMAVCQF
jgi:hypothetical protein